MSDQVLIGKIESIAQDNSFGIIVEGSDLSQKVFSGSSSYFNIDDLQGEPKIGQIVQFVKQDSAAGPQAKRVMVLIDTK